MPDLEFTGERLVPSKSPPALEAEHRARYEFAKQFVMGKKTLDLGCGEGYGSRMLSEVASTVVGVDVSTEAIEHAKSAYSSPNLFYQVADVTKLPFPDKDFEACVCFEVIEHIGSPEAMLKEVARILKPDGIFVVSTPNGAVKVSSQKNPYHKREYTSREFATFLEARFKRSERSMTIYGQFAKGKRYSSATVCLKNAYLRLKGALGLGKKHMATEPQSIEASGIPGFEFKTERIELAEYLVALIMQNR